MHRPYMLYPLSPDFWEFRTNGVISECLKVPVSVPDPCLTKDRQDRHENSSSGTPVPEIVVQAIFQACLTG